MVYQNRQYPYKNFSMHGGLYDCPCHLGRTGSPLQYYSTTNKCIVGVQPYHDVIVHVTAVAMVMMFSLRVARVEQTETPQMVEQRVKKSRHTMSCVMEVV